MWRVGPLAVAVSTAAGLSTDVQCMQPAAPPGCAGPKTPNEFINTLLSPSVYDKSQRPSCDGKSPTVVEAQFDLLRVGNIDQKLGIVPLSGFFKAWWKDPRLEFNGTSSGGCFDVVTLSSAEVARWLWTPDLYIDNLVEKTVDGFASSAVIEPDGTVLRTEQVILKVKNYLGLGKLPYDRHTAMISVASYSQDTTRLRLTARGGVVGGGQTGIGITAPPISSATWSFPGEGKEGFSTPGYVDTLDFVTSKWDYVYLSFEFGRQPKFLMEQVVLPANLFILVSYIQFWVDPGAAPARAALAVIPVLIMLTLSSSMYRSLPEGSQRMWLTDNLMTLTFLCILAALEFGVVQYCTIVEKARADKCEGLKSMSAVLRSLLTQADAEDKALADLVDRYTATEKPGPPTCASEGAEVDRCRASPDEAVAAGIKEGDLLFIRYASHVFHTYDKDGSNRLTASEVQHSLAFFNIYVSFRQVHEIMCMFLRDHGDATPEDERKAELTSTEFCILLLEIGKYSLKHRSETILGYFQSFPPSKRIDIVARAIVPLFLIVQQVVMHFLLPTY